MHQGDSESLEIGFKDAALDGRVVFDELFGLLKVLCSKHDQTVGPFTGGASRKEEPTVIQGPIKVIEMGGNLLNFILRCIVGKCFPHRF